MLVFVMENEKQPRAWRFIYGWSKRYAPHVALSLLGIGILGICGYSYVSRRHEKLRQPVYKKIINRSRPKLLYGDTVIPREDDKLLQWFIQRDLACDPCNKQFGVVVGPTGTGKSALIREVCNKDPKGTLYVEVREPEEFV